MRYLFTAIIVFSLLGVSQTDVYSQSASGTPDARVNCIGDEFRDTDGDGLCDNLDLDDDNDGCADVIDDAPLRWGPDTDNDGFSNACDDDDDNDGVLDADDPEAFNPSICGDSDNDGCDDCSIGSDGFGPRYDIDPANDGPDADGDGLCDAPEDCGPPENLALIDSDWFLATLGWDEVPAAASYDFQLKLSFLPYVFNYATVYTNEHSSRVLPFLTWEFRVRADCDKGDEEWSDWHPFSINPFANSAVGPTASDELIATRKFKTYPNPTSGIVKMQYSGAELDGAEIIIMDLSGRSVYYDVLDWMPNEEKSLDIGDLENGMYLINLSKNGESLATEKIFLSK